MIFIGAFLPLDIFYHVLILELCSVYYGLRYGVNGGTVYASYVLHFALYVSFLEFVFECWELDIVVHYMVFAHYILISHRN